MTADSRAKLVARYGTEEVSPLSQCNAVIEQLLDHRSVRAFAERPLPEGTLTP